MGADIGVELMAVGIARLVARDVLDLEVAAVLPLVGVATQIGHLHGRGVVQGVEPLLVGAVHDLLVLFAGEEVVGVVVADAHRVASLAEVHDAIGEEQLEGYEGLRSVRVAHEVDRGGLLVR